VQWIVCLALGVSALAWGQVVATIPSKRLPKGLAYGRGEVKPTKIHINGDYALGARSRALVVRRNGQQLWFRGMALFGLHYRVIKAFQMKNFPLGQTAPKMTATAAENWRASYRRYHHKKHHEHKTRVPGETGDVNVNGETTGQLPETDSDPAFAAHRHHHGHRGHRRRSRSTEKTGDMVIVNMPEPDNK